MNLVLPTNIHPGLQRLVRSFSPLESDSFESYVLILGRAYSILMSISLLVTLVLFAPADSFIFPGQIEKTEALIRWRYGTIALIAPVLVFFLSVPLSRFRHWQPKVAFYLIVFISTALGSQVGSLPGANLTVLLLTPVATIMLVYPLRERIVTNLSVVLVCVVSVVVWSPESLKCDDIQIYLVYLLIGSGNAIVFGHVFYLMIQFQVDPEGLAGALVDSFIEGED